MTKEQEEKAMQRSGFTFYASFQEAIEDLEDSEPATQLAIYRAICRYGLFREEPELKGVSRIIWRLVKPSLDKQWIKYINSLNGGAKVGNDNARKNKDNEAKHTDGYNADKAAADIVTRRLRALQSNTQ